MQLSYWEKSTYFNTTDVLIIGSGIVGLFAALEIKKLAPKLKVLILERGALPSGASSKNAGFACFGSPGELLDDIANSSETEVMNLVQKRIKGLTKLRKTLGDKAIDYKGLGGYEVFDTEADYEHCAGQLSYLNNLVKESAGIHQTYSIADSKIKSFGFDGVRHLLYNSNEGQINTGSMMKALVLKVQKTGTTILNGISIKSLYPDASGVVLDDNTELKANKILVCTNGFAQQLLPNLNVHPARAQVLITNPIKDLKIKGSFHFDKGYYYFRNIDDRILLGGGRNLDFKGEETYNLNTTPLIQSSLEKLLQEKILPNTKFEIEQRWSGIMGLGKEKSPIIKQINSQVYCAVRLGGMGVALGSLVGEEAAKLIV
ncbi:MAG TPA: FAD-dependent oxidoreductase [Bacteroidia bacterium]|nr:FAD-dependent oxidoreductase [Bacteroidia bacterium]HRH08324.1 FAD-dependent oxidoreductase [Bacteroidia bacterium]